MANGRVTYNPRTGTVSDYSPRYQSIDPDSFMEIVQSTAARLAKQNALSTSPNVTSPSSPTQLHLSEGTLAYLQSMRDTKTKREIKRQGHEDFFKGKHRSELSPEIRKLYDQVQRQKKQSDGWKDDVMSGFGRVLDVLSRGNYASAEAMKRVFDASADTDNDDAWYERFDDAGKGLVSGFWSGLRGKDKTTFSSVIQHMHDAKDAAEHGQNPADAEYGRADVNGLYKGGVGFVLDVFLDPTTYVGVGLVKSAAKGGLKAVGKELGEEGVEKETDHLAEVLHAHGVDAPISGLSKETADDAERLDVMKAYLGDLAGTSNRAHARTARIRNMQSFTTSARATVTASRVAVERQKLLAERASDFMEVPTDEVLSKTRIMDVPVDIEDAEKYITLSRQYGELNSKKAVLSKELNEVKALKSVASQNKNQSNRALDKIGKSRVNELTGTVDKSARDAFGTAASRKALDEKIAKLEAQIAEVTKQADSVKKKLDDEYNIIDADPEVFAQASKVISEHPEVQHLDVQIRKQRDRIRALEDKFEKADARATAKVRKQDPKGKGVAGTPRRQGTKLTAKEKAKLNQVWDRLNKWRSAAHEARHKGQPIPKMQDVTDLDADEIGLLRKAFGDNISAERFLKMTPEEYKRVMLKTLGKVADDAKGKDVLTPELQAAHKYLDELLERRQQVRVNSFEDALAKVAPDKGTLISKARQMSDIGLIKGMAEAVDETTKNTLRRELAYRFAEKGDKYLAAVVRKAEQVNPDLVEDLRNLTPLKRPPKHRVRKRQIVVEEIPVRRANKSEVKAAESHNKKIMTEIERKAQARATRFGREIENQLVEIMAREAVPDYRRTMSLRIQIPFTKSNNPKLAHTLFAFQLPDAVQRAVEKYVFRDVVKSGVERWGKFFKASAGTDPLLNEMRLGYNGAANFRIEQHANRLRSIFSNVRPADRTAAFRQWRLYGDKIDENTTGPYAALVREIDSELRRVAAILTNNDLPGGRASLDEINAWMPDNFKFHKLTDEDWSKTDDTFEYLRKSLRHFSESTDPAEFLWNLNIAREKILTKRAIIDNIKYEFGIPLHGEGAKVAKTLLRREGYKKVPEVGDDVIFAPDVADDITKTLNLLKNEKQVNDLVKWFDKVMMQYKSMVTMWNPGYHGRNSFGDGFMNYLAGVSGKSGLDSYRESRKIISALKGLNDEQNPVYQAVMDINPMAAFDAIESKPSTVIFKHRGQDVSAEELWVLYNHHGLHAGFVSNEFGTNFATPGSVRATGLGQKAGKANRKVRELSEWREDFFRLAHFIHVIKQSNSPLDHAAKEAAASVRKYLFDYSDFTQIEKSTMIRLLPFYKWTRKAIPLMAETLLAQPGKALVYPKAMQNLSVALGYNMGDANGRIPQSDVVIPEWIRQRGMWPIGEKNGNTVYADAALPFNDVARTVSNPMQSFLGMLTPAIRMPAELAMGQKFYGHIPVDSKSEYAASSFPQTNFLAQMLEKNERGEVSGAGANLTDPRTLQFLSGLTLSENTDRQMKNDLIRQQKEISKHKKENK